jgi:DNA anti-recombination protein RmuC
MSSKVISLRFSDNEIQALETLQTEENGGSLNQTAAQLLTGILGISKEVFTGVDINKLVEEKISAAASSLQTKLELVEERLGKLNA